MPDYRSDKKSRKSGRQPSELSPEQKFLDALFRGVAGVFMLIFRLFQRGGSAAGRPKSGNRASLVSAQTAQELGSYWSTVVQPAASAENWPQAISEADKLLDAAFQSLGASGTNMGERLTSSGRYFTHELYQQIWTAHKLRNRLAHEVGVQVEAREAAAALQAFSWGLRALGVFV